MATQLKDNPASDDSDGLMEAYVRRWFVPFETLVRRSGGSAEQVEALIAAGAAPGAIYAGRPGGGWWSTLAAFKGEDSVEPPAGSEGWYTPAALYWLRRALLVLREGASPAEAAERNRDAFVDQFVAALKAEPLASANYPEAFDGAELDIDSARRMGVTEWGYWRTGAYAICLRSFTGAASVAKESVAKKIKEELAARERTISDFELLDLVERLASLMLPFAPSERPSCTPGVTVDRVIELLKLGHEEPYGPPA